MPIFSLEEIFYPFFREEMLIYSLYNLTRISEDENMRSYPEEEEEEWEEEEAEEEEEW